jgi:hypothetical protein
VKARDLARLRVPQLRGQQVEEKPFRVRVGRQGDRRQAQPGRPSLGAAVEQPQPILGQGDPRGREQFPALLYGIAGRTLPWSSGIRQTLPVP